MSELKWKSCPGYPQYEISECGDVRIAIRALRGRKIGTVLKPRMANSGYLSIDLGRRGERHGQFVHRLVLRAFVGEPPSESYQAAHNDGNRLHNHFSNLRWATTAENHADKRRHGTHCAGELIGTSKLTVEQVLDIRARADRGELQRDISAIHGVRQTQISRIVLRTRWAHLPVSSQKQ